MLHLDQSPLTNMKHQRNITTMVTDITEDTMREDTVVTTPTITTRLEDITNTRIEDTMEDTTIIETTEDTKIVDGRVRDGTVEDTTETEMITGEAEEEDITTEMIEIDIEMKKKDPGRVMVILKTLDQNTIIKKSQEQVLFLMKTVEIIMISMTRET